MRLRCVYLRFSSLQVLSCDFQMVCVFLVKRFRRGGLAAWPFANIFFFPFRRQFIIRMCFHCISRIESDVCAFILCACVCVVEDGAEINVWVSWIWGPSGRRMKPCQTLTEVSWAVIVLSFSFTLSTSSNETVILFRLWNFPNSSHSASIWLGSCTMLISVLEWKVYSI